MITALSTAGLGHAQPGTCGCRGKRLPCLDPKLKTLPGMAPAMVQVITEPDERYDAYCASSDFIREHIFPGGHLPSMGAMVEAARPTQLQARCRCTLR